MPSWFGCSTLWVSIRKTHQLSDVVSRLWCVAGNAYTGIAKRFRIYVQKIQDICNIYIYIYTYVHSCSIMYLNVLHVCLRDRETIKLSQSLMPCTEHQLRNLSVKISSMSLTSMAGGPNHPCWWSNTTLAPFRKCNRPRCSTCIRQNLSIEGKKPYTKAIGLT